MIGLKGERWCRRRMAIAVLLLVVLMAGCSHRKTTYVPAGEKEYCQKFPESAICIGLFKEAAAKVLEKFQYVEDIELYGHAEHWAHLKAENNQLWGDCEDCAITIANELVAVGLSADHISLYLAMRHWEPDHIIVRYGRYFVDCSAKKISRDSNYSLVSRRLITSSEWEPYYRL